MKFSQLNTLEKDDQLLNSKSNVSENLSPLFSCPSKKLQVHSFEFSQKGYEAVEIAGKTTAESLLAEDNSDLIDEEELVDLNLSIGVKKWK